jgi:hypothetical protein
MIHEEVPITEYEHVGPYNAIIKRVKKLILRDMDHTGTLVLPLCEILHIENCSITNIQAPKLKYIRSSEPYPIPVNIYDFDDTCVLTLQKERSVTNYSSQRNYGQSLYSEFLQK